MSDTTVASPTSTSGCSEGAASAGRLRGSVRRVADLTARERGRMFELMTTYFADVTAARFAADLDEKKWAVVLEEAGGGRLCGFSTMMRLEAEVAGERVVALYSGDTIVEREYWGESVLPRVWSRHAFRVAADEPGRRAYWLLICSGYKTYRFLPVFFRRFYPSLDREAPRGAPEIAAALCRAKFGAEYRAAEGVVRFDRATPLQAGVAEVTEQRLRDPHVAFFHRVNPGHGAGDELVCLTELVPDNLTPAGRRMVFGSAREGASVRPREVGG